MQSETNSKQLKVCHLALTEEMSLVKRAWETEHEFWYV